MTGCGQAVNGKRDLLFGVPELPEQTPSRYADSAFADNVGLAMLRSQTPNRPVREQIQAALHYGTHGWAHGHFDRTDLISLMRYGRSFWNPESVFWVYEPFMYKFFGQCSVMRFGPGADNEGSRTLGNEDGVLKTDVHSLWPLRQEIMIGTAPEMFPVEKRLFYTVRGEGKTLAEGKFGAWILGSADVDVPLDGVKQLELETRTELSKKPTLFWANARVVTKDGKEIPLSEFGASETGVPARVTFENIEHRAAAIRQA